MYTDVLLTATVCGVSQGMPGRVGDRGFKGDKVSARDVKYKQVFGYKHAMYS